MGLTSKQIDKHFQNILKQITFVPDRTQYFSGFVEIAFYFQ